MSILKGLMTLLSKEGLQEQRSEIIYHFTEGKKSSARELNSREISALYNAIKGKTADNSHELDKKRKRLLAAIFGMFEELHQKPSMEYVKTVACRGAKVKSFNEIPPHKLNSLYNAFIHAQKDLSFARRLAGNIEQELTYLN